MIIQIDMCLNEVMEEALSEFYDLMYCCSIESGFRVAYTADVALAKSLGIPVAHSTLCPTLLAFFIIFLSTN